MAEQNLECRDAQRTNTSEYTAFKKMKVYHTTLEIALNEGEISKKERFLLDQLRDSLGINPTDAKIIEEELKQSMLAQAPIS